MTLVPNSPVAQQAYDRLSELKMAQATLLAALGDEVIKARRAGNTALASKLTHLRLDLSQQNLVLYRAQRKVLAGLSLHEVNDRLARVVAAARAAMADLDDAIKVIEGAAKVVSLLRRLLDVFV